MKNLITFLFFTFCIGFSYCQTTGELNQVNAKGERVGVWKKYYESGVLRYEGQFKNGKEIGVFNFYVDKSTVKLPVIVKTYEEGSSIAKTTFYTEKGVVESHGNFEGKLRVGKWIYYHTDGKAIMIEENYEDGKLNGPYKVFYKDGGLTKISHYKNGVLNGNSKKYSKEGVLLEDVYYINGALNGPAVFYETNGQIKFKGDYDDDLKVGVWKFYQGGELTKSKNITVIDLKEEEVETR